ncbi:hypothetical protein B7494_g6989 [Chlorociboria aeruginascens]|nr:hypothetical protein B7494_g6989 [Chlorociboria aeruginascens]
MQKPHLPLSALPAWSKLNDVTFFDTCVRDTGRGKGFGLVTTKALNSRDTFDVPTLLVVPRDLVLSREGVEEFGKVDGGFRGLRERAGGKITIASGRQAGIGVSNPWTEYVKMLPDVVPVPTMWNEEERALLVGTSLESALNAKMSKLIGEFETLRENTMEIEWCKKSNAYYEEIPNDGIALLLRPGMELDRGTELTISYGASKSEAEMLFNYGFIDAENMTNAIVLTVEPFSDDPLGKAKIAAFSGPLVIRISKEDDEIKWESPFLYLMCLNEEDGLEFKILQQNDGSHSLRLFWQGCDVSETSSTFDTLISGHELEDVFKLRTVVLLQDRIRQQLERLYETQEIVRDLQILPTINADHGNLVLMLRKAEVGILEAAFEAIDYQKTHLMESDIVLHYLASNAGLDEEHLDDTSTTNEDEDFS